MFVRITPEDIDRSNLLVMAPTGSGKTTATLMAVGELLRRRAWRRAVVAVPTLAIAREVYRKAVKLYGTSMVGIATSEAKVEKGWSPAEYRKPLLVTTYEVVDAMMLSRPTDFDRAILVIDEVHQIASSRTTTIQSILANAKFLENELGARIRIVALSATIPDAEELANYLEARLIVHGQRPVEISIETRYIPTPLRRGLSAYVGAKLAHLFLYLTELYNEGARLLRSIDRAEAEKLPPDFKTGMNRLRRLLRERLDSIEDEGLRARVKDWLDRFPILVYFPNRRVVARIAESAGEGAVYHHAGLPAPDKIAIENELRKEFPEYWLVAATDTLAMGVNTAVGTVVVLGLTMFSRRLGTTYVRPETVMQVAGRAGRPRYGKKGYVYIVATEDERPVVEQALAKKFSGIPEVDDYPALLLRLSHVGYNLDVWSKYAFKIDREKFGTARNALEALGVLARDGTLSEFGRIAASRYVDTQTLVPTLVVAAIDEAESRRPGDKATALYYVLAAASWSLNYEAMERELQSNVTLFSKMRTGVAYGIEQVVMEYENLLEKIGFEATYDGSFEAVSEPAELIIWLARAGGIRYPPRTILPGTGYFIYMTNPGLLSPSVIESVVHAAKWLRDAAGARLADGRVPVEPRMAKYFGLYAEAFDAARRVAKIAAHPIPSILLERVFEDADTILSLGRIPRSREIVDAFLKMYAEGGKSIAEVLLEERRQGRAGRALEPAS